jgi:hypothetical protein
VKAKADIEKADPEVAGFNVGMKAAMRQGNQSSIATFT